jgi:preprotein translocase subunit SecD
LRFAAQGPNSRRVPFQKKRFLMNRYPVWKYTIIVIVLLVGLIYALPNFFGEAPAVQVSAAKTTIKVDAATQARVEAALKAASVAPDLITLDGGSLRARFLNTQDQLKGRDIIQRALVPDSNDPPYTVALNLLSRSPKWLTSLHAFPMYLGLDLRGGVDFLLQVDMKGAIDKKAESFASDLRTTFRDKNIRGTQVSRNGQTVEVSFRDAASLDAAKRLIQDQFTDLSTTDTQDGGNWRLVATIKPEAARRLQDAALKQNITTLHNRINELGVAEPVIQQQGLDRIVVQLPGVQDTAKAKEILGRTATLEMRMVDESAEGRSAELSGGPVPFGSEKFLDRQGRPVIVKKQVLVTGENLTDAQPGFDQQSNQPKVDLTMDAKGGRIMRDVSRENYKKRMAMLIFEKGKGEVLTAPSINGELGNRFQVSGSMTVSEANDLALLLRAGSLAAPMEIIQERTIGPSLGADNIEKGFKSVMYGFLAIMVFMCAYYALFGLFSSIALAVNLMLLVAILSMLQATLTLPGIAAMALAIGVAIDSNVLINERVREELRNGASPQAAIHAGYERAWGTILDSNVTTLIAGIALLAFGSGPVRGFAVVHCIGIVTSMFSAVFFSRGLVNFWYGQKKKLKTVSIGTVWRPDNRRLGRGHQVKGEDKRHGILPHPQDDPVHAPRSGAEHRLRRHLRAGGVLPVPPRAAPVGRVHGRHGDGGRVQAIGRHRQGARRHRQARLPGRAGAELRLLREHPDPPAGPEGHELRPAERAGHAGAEVGRRLGHAARHRSGRTAGGRGAHHQRHEGPGHGGGRHHDLPGVPLRMEVRAGYRAGQPARRGDHPGLLRLLPVGVLAGGAGGGACGAGVFGERVGRDLRPDPRELPPLPEDDDHRDHRQRDHLDHQPDHHHPRLHAARGAVDVLLRRSHAALLRAGADHRHLLRHLLLVLRGRGHRHVAGHQARRPGQGRPDEARRRIRGRSQRRRRGLTETWILQG